MTLRVPTLVLAVLPRALRALCRPVRQDDPDTAGLDVDAVDDDWADVDDAYEYADQLDDELTRSRLCTIVFEKA